MQRHQPPDLSNLPDKIDPDNIPGIDYYLEALEKPDGDPSCINDYDDLTVKGCIEAANTMGPRFKEVWDRSTELLYGQREGN